MRTSLISSLVACCLSLSAQAAAAEIVEKDDEDAAAPASAARAPIRARRKWAISGEAGYNGLAGIGPIATFNALPQLSFDLGAGLSAVGLKVGARARYNLLESSWSPFLATGLLYGGGAGDEAIEIDSDGKTAKVRVRSSPYLQAAGGLNYTGNGGFTFAATLGYAFLLRKENVEYVSGSTSLFEDVRKLCGSGIVLGVSFGYAF